VDPGAKPASNAPAPEQARGGSVPQPAESGVDPSTIEEKLDAIERQVRELRALLKPKG
jgi:hypothetical protein